MLVGISIDGIEMASQLARESDKPLQRALGVWAVSWCHGSGRTRIPPWISAKYPTKAEDAFPSSKINHPDLEVVEPGNADHLIRTATSAALHMSLEYEVPWEVIQVRRRFKAGGKWLKDRCIFVV